MIESECNLRAGVYKVQTFGTTHRRIHVKSFICVGKTYSDEMEMSLLFCTLVSLVATWATTRKWIRIAQEAEITGLDMNKPEQQKVSEMGGSVCGFWIYIRDSSLYRTTYYLPACFDPYANFCCALHCVHGLLHRGRG